MTINAKLSIFIYQTTTIYTSYHTHGSHDIGFYLRLSVFLHDLHLNNWCS